MHILLIHQAFVTTGEAGGTRHIEIAQRLAAKGHQITILTSPVSYLTGENHLPGHYLYRSEQYAENIRILYCHTSSGMHKGFIPRLGAFFSFMHSAFWTAAGIHHVDVVWGTSPNIFQAFTAWNVARLKRTGFLLEIRDLWPEFAVAAGALRNPFLIRCSLKLEKFLYLHADQIVVNSPGFIPHIRKICGRTALLAANGSDIEMFRSKDGGAAFRERYGLNNKFVVMYSGAHGPANDLGTVLKAADRLRDHPEIMFVFVGSGKDKARLESEASQMGLSNVLFTPPVSKDQIADVLAASDAGLAILQPVEMFKTTYPNKVFDIMAAGKPVLCQIDGVIRNVVEENGCGVFIQPGNAEALAEVALKYSKDPADCRKMGEAGQKAIREKYSREKTAEIMESILKGVARHG